MGAARGGRRSPAVKPSASGPVLVVVQIRLPLRRRSPTHVRVVEVDHLFAGCLVTAFRSCPVVVGNLLLGFVLFRAVGQAMFFAHPPYSLTLAAPPVLLTAQPERHGVG